MPPKKSLKSSKNVLESGEKAKNSISNLFNKIQEKDPSLKECPNCQEKCKSCLLKDHLLTKCLKRLSHKNADKSHEAKELLVDKEIIFLGESNSSQSSLNKKVSNKVKKESIVLPKSELDEFTSTEKSEINLKNSIQSTSEELNESFSKKRKLSESLKSEKVNTVEIKNAELLVVNTLNKHELKNDEIKTPQTCLQKVKSQTEIMQIKIEKEITNENTIYTNEFDYYLTNFNNAIQSILDQKTFECLLSNEDRQVFEKFDKLKSNNLIF